MFKFFDKSAKKIFRKSYSIVNYLGYTGNCTFVDTSFREDIQMYYSNSTVRKAIKVKSDLGASLRPLVRDKKTKEEVEDHPVLELLNNPSFSVSFKEFMGQFITNYEITANNFNLVSFQLANDKNPLEIYNVSPVEISYLQRGNGKVERYTRTITSGTDPNNKQVINYNRETIVSPKYEVIFKDDKDRQLWHTREYNPLSDSIMGKSKISTLYDEIKGIVKALRHNRKLIENGCSPTGLLISKKEMTDEEYDQFHQRFSKNFTGENKAGKIQFLEGDLEYQETHVSPRDMDWINGSMYMDRRIYEMFGVPRALIDEKASTFNNIMNAKAQLYEFEIFPMLDKIYGELSDLLMPKYKGSENLELYYSKENIASLDAVKTESTLNKSRTGVYKINELRKELGLEELEDEIGNQLVNSGRQQQRPEEETSDNAKNLFVKFMKKDGYTKKSIDLIVKDYEKEGLL
jgi:HK97 family phage portal protein